MTIQSGTPAKPGKILSLKPAAMKGHGATGKSRLAVKASLETIALLTYRVEKRRGRGVTP